ncbi:MAG: sigma-70 family RNA polymerase sigma factor [Gammaproteobacteria bacterium]
MSNAPEQPHVRSLDSATFPASLDRQYRRVLISYFCRRVSSTAEAEDLTQDVFERLLLTLKAGPVGNVEALLFRIAVNLLRDRARRLRTRAPVEPLPSEEMADFAEVLAADLSPERVVIGERTLQEVDAILHGLGERTRAVFYLHRLERLKVREIANVYGVSVSAIEKQLAKALRELTLRLNGD